MSDRLGLGTQPDPLVVKFRAAHRTQACELWRERFGSMPHIEETLDDAVDSESCQAFVAVRPDDGVVGLGIAYLERPTTTDEWFPDGVSVPEAWDRVLTLFLNVVDSDCEGQGLGRTLMKRRLRWGQRNNADGAVATAWHNSHGRDARGLLTAAGFETVTTINDYYPDRNCPVCAGDGCHCAASIVIRPFTARDGGESV